MKEFLVKNFKWLVIAGIVILLFMMWKGCGNKKTELIKDYKREYDSVVKILNAGEVEYENAVKTSMYWQDRNDSLETELLKANSVIDYEQDRVNDLVREVNRISKQQLPENPLKKPCDSLADFADRLRKSSEDFEQQCFAALLSRDSTEISLRNEISILSKNYEICRKTLDYGAKEVLPRLKPKPQLFLSIGLLGTQQTPFNGYSVNLELITPKGAGYSVGSVWVGGQQVYQVEYKRRLSLRKR